MSMIQNNYIFPFQMVTKNSKIVIYGAGNVGKYFFSQIEQTKYAEIVAWVDQSWKQCRRSGLDVLAVTEIKKIDFDFIVIAIDNARTAAIVRNTLLEEYGVEPSKIVFSNKYRYTNYAPFRNAYEKTDDKENLKEIDPRELLCSRRLDLVVRYLLAKDILNDIKNEVHLSLYARMILAHANGYEGEHYFSEYTRNGSKEFIDALKKLCESMKEKGFDKNKFVPVGNNDCSLNGSHRISTALALEEKIWTKYYLDLKGTSDYTMKWFEENGFNTEDKVRILRGYADLYQNCGIVCFYGSSIDQWEYLQAQLSKQVSIVGSVDYDFTNNYIAFENLIRELYQDPLCRNSVIGLKLDLLKLSPLKMRIILVSDEGYKDMNLYETLTNAKYELRNRMFFETDLASVVLHASDSYEEFVHIKNILLSVNNMKHLQMRVTRNYTERLITNLDRLKKYLKKKGIPKEKVLIVGATGWEIFGLRSSSDLDVVISAD